MPDVLIRNVPEDVLKALRARAERHRRSLQQELAELLEISARGEHDGLALADQIRARLAARHFSDCVPDIRQDRQQR